MLRRPVESALAALVRTVDDPSGRAAVQSHVERCKHQIGRHLHAKGPAHHLAAAGIGHDGQVQKTFPGEYVCQILLANSSSCRPQSGEARDACSGTRAAIKPRDGACHIDANGYQHLLQRCLCNANITASPHTKGTHVFGQNTFHASSCMRWQAWLSASYSGRGWQ